MDCAKRIAGVGCLPDDALVEILSLLPVKFLYRSKCVSKAWRDLITDRLRYGKKLPLMLEGFFYAYGSNEDDDDDCRRGANKDEGCLNMPDEVHGSFVNLLGKPSPLIDASLSFVRNQPSEVYFEYLTNYSYLTLLDSCNGLLLFGKNIRDKRLYDNRPHGYIVCNPATEHWVHVPSSEFPTTRWGGSSDDGNDDEEYWGMFFDTHLIFDPVVSSHFQLIELSVNSEGTAVSTFSSETKRWSDRLSEWKPLKKGGEWDFLLGTINSGRCSTFFNKMLHLIISPSNTSPELIVAVDRKAKICRVSRWLENRGFPVFVGQSKGLLHCITVSGHSDGNSRDMTELQIFKKNMSELSIWVLEDYDAEVWNLKHTVSFLELFGRRTCQFDSDYNVATIHPDHNLVFFVEHWDYNLISYDMDRKEVCALCNVGRDYMRIIPYFPYFSESPALSKKNFELRPF